MPYKPQRAGINKNRLSVTNVIKQDIFLCTVKTKCQETQKVKMVVKMIFLLFLYTNKNQTSDWDLDLCAQVHMAKDEFTDCKATPIPISFFTDNNKGLITKNISDIELNFSVTKEVQAVTTHDKHYAPEIDIRGVNLLSVSKIKASR